MAEASRSREDLSDAQNLKDAEFELDRCLSDFDFARWARRWGRPALNRCATLTEAKSAEDVTPIEERLI